MPWHVIPACAAMTSEQSRQTGCPREPTPRPRRAQGGQARAEIDGDHLVVNGSKIWTSYADKADWIFCLVRTDKANKYQGISFLLFDMDLPGIALCLSVPGQRQCFS